MPNTVVEWNAYTNEDILVVLKATALVDRLNQQLPELEAATLWRKLGDAEGQTNNGDFCSDSTRGAHRDTLPFIAQCKV